MNMTKYYLDKVRDGSQKGWLKVSLIDNREIIIPYGIIVEQLGSDERVATYKVLEGIYHNALILVPKSNYSLFSPYLELPTFTVEINLLAKQLRVNNKNYPVIVDNLFRPGAYNIHLPDYPHKETFIRKYQNEASGGSRFASTWFKLVSQEETLFNSSTYFHFGTYSQGCITFPYRQKLGRSYWNDIVMSLSRTRIKNSVCCQLIIY